MEIALPTPPERPDDRSCCGRGCCPCIFDYYGDALDRWKDAVRALGGDPDAALAHPSGDGLRISPETIGEEAV